MLIAEDLFKEVRKRGRENLIPADWRSDRLMESEQDGVKKDAFSHHQQGSIDFNTVNIQRTKCVYFLIFTVPQGVYREILP